MSKRIVNTIVSLAAAAIDNKSVKPALRGQEKQLQDWFDRNPFAAVNTALNKPVAELVEILTGFKPELTILNRPAMFEVFINKTSGKPYICLSTEGYSHGCGGMSDGYYYFDPNGRMATPGEARAFIKDVVSLWSDVELCQWVAARLGGSHIRCFLDAVFPEGC